MKGGEGELKAGSENSQPSTIMGSLKSMGSAMTTSASAMAHTLANKTRSFTEELKQHVGDGKIHASLDDGLKARINYFEAFKKLVTPEVFKQDGGDVQILFPEPAGMDLGNPKITKKEHLGGKFSKITVKSILDGFENVGDDEFKKIHDVKEELEANKPDAINGIKEGEGIKKFEGGSQQHFINFLNSYLDELQTKNINITAETAVADDAAKTQAAAKQAEYASKTIEISKEQKIAIAPFSQILATNKYLPNLFLVFDKESKPKMYYYEHSITDDVEASGPSNYRDKLNGLFGKEGDESKIPIIDITKENSGGTGGFMGVGTSNTGYIWPILLQNKIKNVGDKGEAKDTSFDPGFNITKSVYKEWSKDKATSGGADEETPPATDGSTESSPETSTAETPASPTESKEPPVNWTEWIDNTENQNKFLIRKEVGTVPTAPTDPKEKKAQMLWNLACYASQTVWRKYYDATKQGNEIWMDKMKDDLTNPEKMKNTWNAFLQADKGKGHFSSTKQVIKWEDALNKWNQEYAGCIGLGNELYDTKERLYFINAEGTIKTVDDSNREYKIQQLDQDYKFEFMISSIAGGKRRRKSHRKSHKKTQKKHKKQMKKSHKKVHKKKTRGKKC